MICFKIIVLSRILQKCPRQKYNLSYKIWNKPLISWRFWAKNRGLLFSHNIQSFPTTLSRSGASLGILNHGCKCLGITKYFPIFNLLAQTKANLHWMVWWTMGANIGFPKYHECKCTHWIHAYDTPVGDLHFAILIVAGKATLMNCNPFGPT